MQIVSTGKNKKNINLSSAEFAQKVTKIKVKQFCCKSGKARWFSPGFSGFSRPLINYQLDISEIFLKGS